MLKNIEDAILLRLETAGLNVVHLDAKPKLDEADMSSPIGRVFTRLGNYERVTSTKLCCKVAIFIVLDLQHAVNATTRLRGLYTLLEAIVSYLTLKTLSLEITPIMPVRFMRQDEVERELAGIVGYGLELETSYIVTEMEDEESTHLLKVGLEYFLQDPEDDGIKDADDLVEFEDW